MSQIVLRTVERTECTKLFGTTFLGPQEPEPYEESVWEKLHHGQPHRWRCEASEVQRKYKPLGFEFFDLNPVFDPAKPGIDSLLRQDVSAQCIGGY